MDVNPNILPSSTTKNKYFNPYGNHLDYIFLNTCLSKQKYITTLLPFTIIFDRDVLINKTFYTNKNNPIGNLQIYNN
jgi:hypothetical protein